VHVSTMTPINRIKNRREVMSYIRRSGRYQYVQGLASE